MQTLAIWLIFFGSLPPLYLIFRIFFDWILYQLLPEKKVLVEFEGGNGKAEQVVLTGKTQKELYKKAIQALRSRDVTGRE
ncbi:TPA: hypothetical protein SMP47_003251 [Proteus mirabilis]|nr:hypothetical protein [Proteus mirabilis]